MTMSFDKSSLPPLIETKRLILRRVDPDADFEAWADCFSDDKTMRFIGGQAMSRAQAWRHMATVIGHYEIWGYSFLSVIEKQSGAWIGRVGHWNPEGWPEPEVGWTIHRDFWRRGYAAEAARACTDYAFSALGWPRVIHTIAEDNIASQNTAKAIGSTPLYRVTDLPPFGPFNGWAWGQERDEL